MGEAAVRSAPLLSVVVPVKDGAGVIGPCLHALARSDLPREAWELIVVDDGSLDGTAAIAVAWADVLVRIPGPPHGSAYARNRGVDASLGAVLVFIDADVCVHRDALRRIAWHFGRRPELAAVFGSYDANPPAPDDISQYRNLRHHYVHRLEPGESETFWTALGAVRRDAFARAGRFDEWHFPRPQIEDVELGYRIRRLGLPILLDPDIEGTHLKKWALRDVVTADLRDRAVPWIRLQLALGVTDRPASLLFRPSEWIGSGLVCLAALLLLEAAFARLLEPVIIAGLILAIVLVSNAPMYRFFWRRRGLGLALRVMPLHLLYYLMNGLAAAWAWLLYHLIGAPGPTAEIQAYSERGVKAWPPLPSKPQASA